MGEGLILGVQASDRNGDLLPWGLRRYRVRAGTVYGGGDCGMAEICGHLVWGGT